MTERIHSHDTQAKDDSAEQSAGQADVSAVNTPQVTPDKPHTYKNPGSDVEHLYAKVKPRRTLGLRLFDIGLYPLLSNFAVFAISVVFTFLTTRGADRRANGELIYGSVGKWFQDRSQKLEKGFQKLGMSEKNAEMGKIVAFSFLDGSIMALPIKLLEDRRERIARWIDEKFGTLPENESPYKAEPKQSWWSVIGGRAITAGIVVPVAMFLSKEKFYRGDPNNPLAQVLSHDTDAVVIGSKTLQPNKSLNDILFNDPAEKHSAKFPGLKAKIGRVIEKLTGVAPHEDVTFSRVKDGQVITQTAKQGDLAFATTARMTYFEAFYTSVCTAGLYVSSRILARFIGDSKEKKAELKAKSVQAVVDEKPPAAPVITPTKIEIPREHDAPHKRVHTQALETSRFSDNAQAISGQPALHGI